RMTVEEPIAGHTLAAARRRLAAQLAELHFDTPTLDARILIGHALHLDHAGLIREADRHLRPEEIAAIAAVAARRLRREPIARIVGAKEFWSLPLAVNAATLVPRPETETVVEAALAAIDAGGSRGRELRLLDIGTGSGALLLALLSELPHASGIGTDICIEALATAQGNAVRLGMSGRAGFVACDIACALRGTFDVIVSNPPYVARDAIDRLAPGVRDYEPRGALDGGPDGLAVYRQIAAQAPALLARGGHLLVELGAGQAEAVAAILRARGLAPAAPHHDLSGIPRALCAALP
ncbi:MAG TPA: peptide chain release factor N(5)-glutamine methyltransferase, partial [Xanthobacteraceae bacterium]|nr:peptide chain release factor N(5)-glutamine methyltransferase [Xanthobacteraceae bacterium]